MMVDNAKKDQEAMPSLPSLVLTKNLIVVFSRRAFFISIFTAMALYFQGDDNGTTRNRFFLGIYYVISFFTAIFTLTTYALASSTLMKNIRIITHLLPLTATLLMINELMLIFSKIGPVFIMLPLSYVILGMVWVIFAIAMCVKKEQLSDMKVYEERFAYSFDFWGLVSILLFFYLALSTLNYDQYLARPIEKDDVDRMFSFTLIFVTLLYGLGAMVFTIISLLICPSRDIEENFYILKIIDVSFTILVSFTAFAILFTHLKCCAMFTSILVTYTWAVVHMKEAMKARKNQVRPKCRDNYNITTKYFNYDSVVFIALPLLLALWKASNWSIENNIYFMFFLGSAIFSEIFRRLKIISPHYWNVEPELRAVWCCSNFLSILTALSLLVPTTFDAIGSVLKPWFDLVIPVDLLFMDPTSSDGPNHSINSVFVIMPLVLVNFVVVVINP